MRRYSVCILAACCLFASEVGFSDVVKMADIPGHPPIPQYNIAGFTVKGYAALSYNYLSQSRYFTSGDVSRLYDADDNGFMLNQIGLGISRQPEQGFGGLLNLIMGRDVLSTPVYGMPPYNDSQNASFEIEQGFLQYALHSVTFMLGRFFSLAGYEEIPPPLNNNYSTALLATFAQPATHTGLRVSYDMNDKVNWVVGLNDGWDNVRDWSRRKTLELGGSYKDEKYSFSAAWYNGQERAIPFTSTGPVGMRNYVDLIAQVKATDKVTLVANYDFVTQSVAALADGDYGRATWQGIAGYCNYQFNTKWRASLRGEYFIDRNGFVTGIRQNIEELTATVGYLVFKNFELRAETRRDVSSTNSFEGKNGDATSNNMQSFGLEGVLTI